MYSLPVESMLAWQHSQLVFHFEVLQTHGARLLCDGQNGERQVPASMTWSCIEPVPSLGWGIGCTQDTESQMLILTPWRLNFLGSPFKTTCREYQEKKNQSLLDHDLSFGPREYCSQRYLSVSKTLTLGLVAEFAVDEKGNTVYKLLRSQSEWTMFYMLSVWIDL